MPNILAMSDSLHGESHMLQDAFQREIPQLEKISRQREKRPATSCISMRLAISVQNMPLQKLGPIRFMLYRLLLIDSLHFRGDYWIRKSPARRRPQEFGLKTNPRYLWSGRRGCFISSIRPKNSWSNFRSRRASSSAIFNISITSFFPHGIGRLPPAGCKRPPYIVC